MHLLNTRAQISNGKNHSINRTGTQLKIHTLKGEKKKLLLKKQHPYISKVWFSAIYLKVYIVRVAKHRLP